MSVIGEAALSAFFSVLYEKLASSELLNLASEAQVHGEIKKWEKMLLKLRLVLEDAEEKKIENRLVKVWVGELKHLAYDVEDILDEFSTESLRRKVKGERRAAGTSKIQKLIPACCTSFTPWTVMFNSAMMSKIGEITARLKVILDEMKELNLVENTRKTSSKVCQRPPSTCLQDEPVVYGRDGDKDKMLELLFRYETGDAKVGVIPIVGMGGIGKTTLAKLVYNDNSKPDHFQIKAWVCVSDVFDIMRVTKGILESITSQSSDLKELNQVQLKLNEQLADKKYLLVLDDVWTNNYDDWHVLRSPLMSGAPGSKIIVTTRNKDAAEMMATVDYHDLKGISDEDCFLLFAKHAFEDRSIAAHPELETVGREIVTKRCGGLPLAARTLGGLLRSRQRHYEWEEVLNNKLWSILDTSSNILPVLELTYYYLPSNLKRCFAYCAILPKDYEFEQKQIILLWMAEGLIPQDDKKEMEDLGSDYFHDLLSRSIFQTSIIDQSKFIMHDLVNDLARKVAEDTCVRLEDEFYVGEESKREKARHSSYIQGYLDDIKRFAPFHKMKCLRTFLPLSIKSNRMCYLAKSVPYELLQSLKFLRVLSLCHYNIRELPDSVGDLKHLRYIDLSDTPIEVLPESTTSLYNLQILVLKECLHLEKLPSRMDNLISLRHLDITGAGLIEGIPLEINGLRGLQTLSNFVVGKGSFTITTLMSLKSLRGEICISNLDNVADASDARKVRLMDKGGIHVLEMKWNSDIDIGDGGVQCDVLDGLQPHRNLEKLIVSDYVGTRFPFWMGDPMFNNMVQLTLDGCKNCTQLPQLGMLPNLKELFIIEMSSLRRIDQEFYGYSCSNPFPSLEILCFQQMLAWEEWNASVFGFRVLRELCVGNCGKLSGELPIHLPSLEKLVISDCENLAASLPSFPMLSALDIRNCKEVDFRCKVDFNSLNMFVLSNIATITNLAEGFVQGLKKFKKLTISGFSSPTTVVVPSSLRRFNYYQEVISTLECVFETSPQLISVMVDEDKEQLQMELAEGSELESLTLRGCVGFKKLPAWIEKLMFLRELTIQYCPNLVTLPEGGVLSMLKVLRITNCNFLSALPDIIISNRQCLEELNMNGCDSLISFGRRQLPPTLKTLRIWNCRNLKSLLEEDGGESSSSSSLTNLEDLDITGCDNLTSISSGSQLPSTLRHLSFSYCSNLTSVISIGKLPSSLQSLSIRDCGRLESIAERFDHNTSLEIVSIRDCSRLKSLPNELHNLTNLCEFEIHCCSSIASFPEGGLPTTHLKILEIVGLEKMEAFPDNMHRLSSLQKIEIHNCSSLVTFPSQGFPLNLTTLVIKHLKICKELFEWGLDGLNSLQSLEIEGGCPDVVSFPQDETGVMLPPSLTRLTIRDFPSLEYLSARGFQTLTSLESLFIWNCPKLASIPENGLPDSLLELCTFSCPLLEQRRREGKGPEWSKILNIPRVLI